VLAKCVAKCLKQRKFHVLFKVLVGEIESYYKYIIRTTTFEFKFETKHTVQHDVSKDAYYNIVK